MLAAISIFADLSDDAARLWGLSARREIDL
jgi:hypothetical protein